MNRLALLVVLLLGLCAVAQQAPTPAPAPKPTSDDISGMYTFLKEGEFVQINLEDDGSLTGFVSRYGDEDNDRGSFLDQFFQSGSYKGNQLSFTTKPVHSVWFQFDGRVERGPGKSPKDEGFRVIRGKLTRYKREGNATPAAQSRELEMKSFPSVDDDSAFSKD